MLKGFVCAHCGLVGKREPGTAWCKDCAPFISQQWAEYRDSYYTGYGAKQDVLPKFRTLRTPKPAADAPPRRRTIQGAGRRIVLPDEPKE